MVGPNYLLAHLAWPKGESLLSLPCSCMAEWSAADQRRCCRFLTQLSGSLPERIFAQATAYRNHLMTFDSIPFSHTCSSGMIYCLLDMFAARKVGISYLTLIHASTVYSSSCNICLIYRQLSKSRKKSISEKCVSGPPMLIEWLVSFGTKLMIFVYISKNSTTDRQCRHNR